jgi:hypothetical protein
VRASKEVKEVGLRGLSVSSQEEERMQMKRFLIVPLVPLMVAVMASAALAASPHFKRGGTPVCTFSGTNSVSVTCRGTLAGLGGDDLLITVSVSGSAVYQCQNGGGNTAPGQNKVLVGPATSSTPIDSDAIKNGNLTFNTNPATLTAPTTVSGSAAGCPNANWTGVNPVLTVTSISLVIEQPVGTVIFSCASATNPTSPASLTC